MKSILKLGMAVAAVCGLSASTFAATLDLNTAEGIAKVNRKFQCSLKDGKQVTYYWHGSAFGRVMGMADKLLFNVEGMNARACVTVMDKDRGYGYRLVSRELLLYKDAKTGEYLKTWDNPYTGQNIKVLHVANDPVNSRPTFGIGRDGKPMKFTGTILDGHMWLTSTVPLFYQNPLAGDYQKNIGGMYHATEMFNFFANEKDMLDGNKDQADVKVAWQRMSDWLPWMEMSGREGLFYVSTAGRMLRKFDDIPQGMRDEIAKNYPIYVTPPPTDDARPNETSWTYFKKMVPVEKKAGE
ncbi:MAG: DUF1838 domain-containing protein [Rhodospirillaceae bacterium]|nr:DUF1838 domain-containing protein [Rhodospirillaceae bacterium]